jgi:hypothetical protein
MQMTWSTPGMGTGGTTALPGTGGSGVITPPATGPAMPGMPGVVPGTGGAAPGMEPSPVVPVDPGMMAGSMAPPPAMGMWEDPGPNPWVRVPEGEVAATCKMDPAMLGSTGIAQPFAVFRYGKLCWQSGNDSATDVFSVTKTVGGVVTATAAYLVRDVPKTGPGTGPFNDYDLASDWGLSSYRAGMQLGYLMSMATGSSGTAWGSRSFAYDTLGSAGLNNMGNVANRALAQDSSLGVANMQAATARLFDKLGMETASWGASVYGTGSRLTLHDMGKLFTLLIHGGVYNGERLIGEDWIYKMTHPTFEDGNTSYGQFMWLNHRGNAAGIGGDLSSGSNSPTGDPCAPAAFWDKYPHEISDAPDCQATVAGASCEQQYDVGVFSAQGLGGQFIVGHPGLDLVLAVKNFSGQDGPMGLWRRIRPALVALDPMFMGDEAAFCTAYGAGNYAPDLKVAVQQPAM